MHGDRWGPDGPPPEAYERVTAPERFAPLHAIALATIERLRDTFDVDAVERGRLDSELEAGDLARPTVALRPRDEGAAPLVIAFSSFPGLRVRAGRWLVSAFPVCGCDACDETAESAAAGFGELVERVTNGRFLEWIKMPAVGRPWLHIESWDTGGRSASSGAIDRTRARAMLAGGPAEHRWRAWPRRTQE